MARRRSATLTEAELRLMEVLWDRGQATVAEVTSALPPPALAYNSVLTTMRILERKGYVTHDEAGRAFIYRPLLGREEAAGHAVGHVLSRFFDNSAGSLALRLIETERPSDDELVRLRALIEEYEEEEK
ncbi:MAG: BlaI/MecI/CopY family transcriptional regulator [Candidatus Eremiobacteraeota bacterium]|nr:BlaI/MecI/CopY family transcriptional regulator [Candidatus Eremiobacteraeota bacterium]MBV9055053.1 BlaI/MecI/CopY family transcriptional regulator [Candidatus Eremiobacteraeota bacterium]MBV9701042.1 BlaI/MecI/CopY family transcriptional regulator [Candidatus Eremiobacteraeota bacterium]